MIIPFPERTEKFRVTEGRTRSSAGDDFGMFYIPCGKAELIALACNEDEATQTFWEHVSVRARDHRGERTPTWAEMCFVKDLFWGPEESVVQYHPPRSEYVNHNPYVLHLWRYTKGEIPRPPQILV